MTAQTISPGDLVLQLAAAIGRAGGNQAAWARAHKFSPSYISDVLRLTRAPSKRLGDALGYGRVVVFVKREAT